MDVLTKHATKTKLPLYGITDLCDVAMLLESVEILHLAWKIQRGSIVRLIREVCIRIVPIKLIPAQVRKKEFNSFVGCNCGSRSTKFSRKRK
jgi:hypothetical protein